MPGMNRSTRILRFRLRTLFVFALIAASLFGVYRTLTTELTIQEVRALGSNKTPDEVRAVAGKNALVNPTNVGGEVWWYPETGISVIFYKGRSVQADRYPVAGE
jgi:hypothetical protein